MPRPPRWLRRLLREEDLESVRQAIALAEASTSGEIRVHVERRLRGREPLGRAREVFVELGMHRTRDRNGVLIYLSVADRHLAIVGDDAIHARVGDGYWDGLRDLMVQHLRQGRPRDALVEAVGQVGQTLHTQFPRRPDDTNELSDQVSTR